MNMIQNEINESAGGSSGSQMMMMGSGGGSVANGSFSNREVRNRAEKMRRDKLNSYISELSKLVPMIYNSSKKFDKASVLRLTVSYLRIHHAFSKIKRNQLDFPKIDQMLLDKLVTEQLNGFLLLLTARAKIVFVSHTIEKLLGHTQNELLGQSIYAYVPTAEHEKLRRCLFSTTNASGSSNSRDTRRRCFRISFVRNCNVSSSFTSALSAAVAAATPPRSPSGPSTSPLASSSTQYLFGNSMPSLSTATTFIYEPVTFVGVSNHCDDLFTYFVSLRNLTNSPTSTHHQRPRIDRPIEGSPDEYVTQHLLDGRIVNCDQRVSLIAGYMAEEIIGISGFKFMHRSDVHWVMIALRQMYDRNESVGSSCYRLLARNGRFVYMCTRGFLEINQNDGTVTSMICVNTLVSEREGKKLSKEMKHRYMNMVKESNSPSGQGEDTENQQPFLPPQQPSTSPQLNPVSQPTVETKPVASTVTQPVPVSVIDKAPPVVVAAAPVAVPVPEVAPMPIVSPVAAVVIPDCEPISLNQPSPAASTRTSPSPVPVPVPSKSPRKSSATSTDSSGPPIEDPKKVDFAIQHLVSNFPSVRASDVGLTSVGVPAAVLLARERERQRKQSQKSPRQPTTPTTPTPSPQQQDEFRQQFESQTLSTSPETFGLTTENINNFDEGDDEMMDAESCEEHNRKFVNIILNR